MYSRWYPQVSPWRRSDWSNDLSDKKMDKEFIITIFSENKVGLLSQVTTVFTHRNVNIESLTASESAIEGVHKYIIAVKNDE